MQFWNHAVVIGAALVLSGAAALAEPTEITVRVVSKDAKFVGTSMGGARVTLRDAETGQLLATGVTEGSTGDTSKIMGQRERRTPMSDDGSAKFTAVLDLDRPHLVEVTAFGPLAQRQSAVPVSSTQWVVPGKHITGGDAWLLELPGLVVDVLDPPTHAQLKGVPQKISLKANVTAMCGCPIEPGGLWDANKYEVAALLARNGKVDRTIPLAYRRQNEPIRDRVRGGRNGRV